MQKINIKLLSNEYNVLIKDYLINDSGLYISDVIPNNSGNIKAIIITDDIVDTHYSQPLIN